MHGLWGFCCPGACVCSAVETVPVMKYSNGVHRMVQALAKVLREGQLAGSLLRCPARMACISCEAWSSAASARAGLQLKDPTCHTASCAVLPVFQAVDGAAAAHAHVGARRRQALTHRSLEDITRRQQHRYG